MIRMVDVPDDLILPGKVCQQRFNVGDAGDEQQLFPQGKVMTPERDRLSVADSRKEYGTFCVSSHGGTRSRLFFSGKRRRALRHHHHVGPGRSLARFPQPSRWQQVITVEWFGIFREQNLKRRFYSPVLESVVEEDDPGFWRLIQQDRYG